MSNTIRSKMVMAFLLSLIISAAAMILVFPSAAANGISDGMRYAAEMLIPSLFPFMVISSFLIRSGASDSFGKAFAPVTEKLFGLPKDCGAAIILSFIGGFPVGAKCVRLLYDEGKINEKQAEQMMLFCVCSGPGFLVTGVGEILLHNTALGWILYISQLCSGVIIGIITGRIIKKPDELPCFVSRNIPEKKKLSDSFIESCSDGANSVLMLTAMVMLFSMLISLCRECGITVFFEKLLNAFGIEYPLSESVFPIIIEVTGACRSIALSGCPLWLLSFAVGFGGLCVHFQIFAILCGIKIKKLRYFLFRIINAFLSSVIVYIVCRFYCPADDVFAISGGCSANVTSVSITGSAALIIMCVVFVLSVRYNAPAFCRRSKK